MDKDTQLHIRLSTQEKECIHKLAEIKGISVSELIRKWIQLYGKSWIADN